MEETYTLKRSDCDIEEMEVDALSILYWRKVN
jgi:hypothetical protein